MFHFTRRQVLGIVIVSLCGLLLVYIGDYGVVRYQFLSGRSPFGQVTVQPFYEIHQKNGKIDFQTGELENNVCVRSLFPHMGHSPCWYLSWHKQKLELKESAI